MDQAPRPLLRSQAVPKLQPHRTHTRDVSRSPTRERGNLSDDILADLSPATTLEAFTNPSGKLKASVENATQSERAFGIRATWASKKIQEWLDELSNWAWPTDGGSQGFEMPPMMRRKTTEDSLEPMGMMDSPGASSIGVEYMGSLPIDTFDHYEVRVEEITEDMEDLDVEDIKRQVLDTHFSPRSRPSSSASGSPMPSVFASYTKMDDLTAIVTATVLHALPNLSNLLRLMDVWKVRLAVLSKVPPLLSALDEIETALEAGWHALGKSSSDGTHGVGSAPLELSRASFDNMRHGLQDKVAVLGRDLDFMLDTLEGRNETLPDIWLDRMEAIEHNYGEWVVHGDRKIREVEWAKMMNARKEAADTWRLEEAREVEEARLREETETAQRARAQPVSSDGQNVQSQVLSGSDGSQELGATERPKTRSLLTSSLFDEDRDGSPPISRLITRSPKSPPQAPRFGHTVSNMLRRTSSPPKPSQDVFPPVRSSISPVTNARMFALHIDRFGNAEPSNSSWPTERRPATSSGVTEPHAQSSMRGDWGPVYFYKAQSPKSIGSTSENSHASVTSGRTSKRHSRNVSTVSGYPSLVPTPETGSTATVEYFQPALQPVTTQSLAHEGNRQEAIDVAPATMPESSTVTTNSANVTSTTCLPDESDPAPQLAPHYPSNVLREIAEPNPNDLTSEYHNAVDKGSTELEERASTPSAIKIPRNPSGSPPSVSIAPSRRQTLHSPTSPTFSLSSEPSESSASSLADAPAFENVNIQQKAAPLSSPKKQSEDQLQQQISSLLESIPARIHLTSEPAVAATNTLRPKKTRRSVTPSFRSQSSLSNRVSTPSFLLSPAYSKTASRPRPQSVHPEIKLYHLSRSADEAPIKLFVRLVGENGERVMVRVGGGWADLGEYLKEYASHHGRRSTVEDKIEIQDLPPRIVSNSSTTSNSTIRGSEYGRSSPMPNFRPATAFDRPASSLNVRKTRKSIGERVIGQRHNVRSPSTPLPMLNRRSLGDSPPPHSTTTTARSSSRLSWAEDDSSLGLAGPKGKKVAISEKDQEWVESMKKKVKQASAEKDRERERGRRIKEKARGESFGEMDKVGGTKRLFRKGPN
ncbi:hypothetical protein BJ875DRAFT_506755 [Amylocarpus encephaloides]|uniref:GAR domain-containing protein n=1 Tax=Amylocarpus encephaloides TaxID=45428 RepID=A0A9P7YD80_9HELO|nr:hypothetical protein BJ875DRAFT_506755 [Amylocarpus encephaloides]